MSNTPHIEGQCAVHRSPFHQSLGRSSGSIDAMREGLPACGLRVVRTVRHTLLNATIAAAVAVAAPDVFATEGKQAQSTTESPDSGTSASSAESTVLEPVTVTARKTTERLQDVPESITVLQAKTLKESPFDPGVAIAGHAPNVQWVSRATGSQWFSIRGVSSLGTPANYSDGTIAFNVDGVPNSMMSASNVSAKFVRGQLTTPIRVAV